MLEATILMLFYAGLGGATWFGVRYWRSHRMRHWQDAAVSCRLQIVKASPGSNPQLIARAGQAEVRIKPSGETGRTTRITIKASGPPDFHRVRIRPQSMFQFTREIEIGDAPFDGAFAIDGPERLVAALLDEGTRRLMSRLNGEGLLDLSLSELRINLSDLQIPRVLPLLLDLHKRFAELLDVPRRLAENASQDPVPGVRLYNLFVLIHELPKDPVTAEALRKAASDPSPEVRLRVAKALGAEGHGILRELAQGVEEDAVSAEAVSALDRELPFEQTSAILDRALTRRRLRTAHACLKAIGRSGAAAAIDALAKVMAKEYGELAPASAQALGTTGSPAAEPPLIKALQRDQSDIRVAAANALGRVGSTAAVLPLKEAAERSRLDLELRRAVRQAIGEIQSRVHGASPGQLSLAGAEAGQLSLAQAEAGQLSLATDPAGQLSISDDSPDAVPGSAASPGADGKTS
jgi:HEAT repeat protein